MSSKQPLCDRIFSICSQKLAFPSISDPNQSDPYYIQICLDVLLAPTGALVLMMVYYISRQRQLFQIFTQSIDAIDVTSVTLSRLNSINAIDVTRCKLMLIEC